MSLYGDYLSEKTDQKIIENEYGFATYQFLPGGIIYLVDIYVVPLFRRSRRASALADEVQEIGKKNGCMQMMGSVNLTAKNQTDSFKAILGYGMEYSHCQGEILFFLKGIK